MAIEFSESAAKHGYTREDAVNAVNNHTGHRPEFEESRDGGLPPHLAIGPALNGDEIEVMYTVHPRGRVRIFYCMEARTKIKRLIEEGE